MGLVNSQESFFISVATLIAFFHGGIVLSFSSNSSDIATSQLLNQPFPFDYPDTDANAAALFPMPKCQNITLAEATIDQLQDAMNSKLSTSVDIVNCYLTRVDQTNDYVK